MIVCMNKRVATKADLKPGLIVHVEGCQISVMALSTTPHNNDEQVMDWSSGEPLDQYPAMVYSRDDKGISTKTGYYTLLASGFHVAEVQKLEEPT